MLRQLKHISLLLLLPAIFLLNACTKDPVKQTTPDVVTPLPTAIGNPVGSAVTKEIGTSGGSITSPDGRITLTIPAGALNTNTSISIQPIENTTPNGVGLSYDFLPNG